jgi:hypothetical protein
MVCVFLAFVLSGDSGAAMAGVGLAAAVALDAFILRTALVPAAMHLLGKSNWWLPAGLEKRLPHLAVEPAEEAELPRASTGGPTVVHGFVRDAEGAPVDGAVLTLLSKGGRQLDRVTSLADGSYIVSVPAPGTYLLSSTSRGVPGFEDPFHIEGDPAADGLGERDEFVGGVDAMHRVAVRGRIGEDVEARVLAVDDDADGDAGPGVGGDLVPRTALTPRP